MNRDRYRTLIRIFFALVFVGGSISHLVLGRTWPDGYAAYGTTAPAWLGALWASFVMPNIAWLTLLLAAFELACGIGMLARGRVVRIAAAAMLGFLIFVTVLGYGFPTTGLLDELLKNRLPTIVLALLVAPLLAGPEPPGLATAWRRAVRPGPRTEAVSTPTATLEP